MGATIYYQPMEGKHLSIGAPSMFLDLLDRLFGANRREFELTEGQINTLRVAASTTDNTEFCDALNEMADALERHGRIRVWPEY